MILLDLLFLAGASLLIWMQWIEPNRRGLNRHPVSILKPLKRPIRILHITDTHFNQRDEALSQFFDKLSQEEVDLIVITGDIMDRLVGIDECCRNLKKLKSVYGTFAVFGNHDYYTFGLVDGILHNFPGQPYPKRKNRVDVFKKRLEEIGVRVLMNETVPLQIDHTPFLIHGLDDPTTGHANIRKTMQQFDSKKINILLTHTVDVFLDIGEGEIDLAFSGHSHGGQVRFPWIGPVFTHTRMGRKYASGIFRIQGAVCCISRGMNAGRHLRFRLLCPPEAILLTVAGS